MYDIVLVAKAAQVAGGVKVGSARKKYIKMIPLPSGLKYTSLKKIPPNVSEYIDCNVLLIDHSLSLF